MKKLVSLFAVLMLLFACAALAEETAPDVLFSESGIVSANENVRVNGNIISIVSGGTYTFSGKAEGAQIQAAVAKGQDLVIILKDLALTGNDGPALYINAKKVTVEVQGECTLSDAPERTADKPAKTVIYATDDLTITGTGTLTVTSCLSHAIQCKDDLVIDGPTLIISSANDGLHGNDSVTVQSGTIRIDCDGDGIQSSNDSGGKGNVVIHGGTISVSSGKSAIQAAGTMQIDGGVITLKED